MEYRSFQAVGLATWLAAAILSVSTGWAAQEHLSAVVNTGAAQAGPPIATPRTRPDIQFARLQQNRGRAIDSGLAAATDDNGPDSLRQTRLPRPRPQYFDLRIDMTDMLGEEELAGLAPEEDIEAVGRPSGDDLQDLY